MKLFITLCLTLATSLSAVAVDVSKSVIRVSTTLQNHNVSQPWNKTRPKQRHALGAILSNHQVLTTAEMVANVNFIQLETSDGQHQFPAKVVAVDYEANLALLAPNTEKGIETLSAVKGLTLSTPAHLGDSVSVVQIEDNGMALVTKGELLGADVTSSFVDGHYFLTYEIKASMQSSANSYTVPVLKGDHLLGLLTSYSNKEQILEVIAPEIIAAFLEDAQDSNYVGFPALGVATARTSDVHFREWLKLTNGMGGIYITRVQPHSSAEKAGVKAGDVLMSINGHNIDRRGYYQANGYGQLYWGHLIRGTHPVGEEVKLGIFRDGKMLELTAPLMRAPSGIIPSHTFGKSPRYLVKGGLIFQELTKSYLEAYGEDWSTRAPLNLLDALNHPDDYQKGRKRLVFISAAIPTPVTLGYESLRSAIVEEVNGQPIEDIPTLIAAFQKVPENGMHTIKTDAKPDTIYLEASASDEVDKNLLLRGIPALSRETE